MPKRTVYDEAGNILTETTYQEVKTNESRFRAIRSIFQTVPVEVQALLMSIGTQVTTAVENGNLPLATYLVEQVEYPPGLTGLLSEQDFNNFKSLILSELE